MFVGSPLCVGRIPGKQFIGIGDQLIKELQRPCACAGFKTFPQVLGEVNQWAESPPHLVIASLGPATSRTTASPSVMAAAEPSGSLSISNCAIRLRGDALAVPVVHDCGRRGSEGAPNLNAVLDIADRCCGITSRAGQVAQLVVGDGQVALVVGPLGLGVGQGAALSPPLMPAQCTVGHRDPFCRSLRPNTGPPEPQLADLGQNALRIASRRFLMPSTIAS